MSLGIIISKRKIKDVPSYITVVQDIGLVKDDTKPILIIGLNEAKKYSSNFSILNKKLSENVFWTFAKNEKRNDYEHDLYKFYEFALLNGAKQIRYIYLNLFKLTFSEIKRLLLLLSDNKIHKYIYIDKNIIYIYYNRYIMGISMDIIKYMNISLKKVFAILYNANNMTILKNKITFNFHIQKLLKNNKYLIPYLLSLEL